MANDLIRATAIINTTIRHQLDAALRPLGLSEVNYYYLLVVAEQPGINQADLTARIVRDQSTVTRQVDRLVKQGWLTKRQAPTDARQSALFLTPQAQAILPQLWAINQTVNETALATLTPAEQATLLNLLGKTFDGLSQDHH